MSESCGELMIGNIHEKDLTTLLETLRDTTKSQRVMFLLINGLGSGTGLQDQYAG